MQTYWINNWFPIKGVVTMSFGDRKIYTLEQYILVHLSLIAELKSTVQLSEATLPMKRE